MYRPHRSLLIAILAILLSTAGCINVPGISAPSPTELVQPTATVTIITATASFTPPPTLTATITPSPTTTPIPTITLTPTETTIPGWVQVVGDEVSLWLPIAWAGGNLQEDLDQLIAAASGDSPEVQQYANLLEQNRSAVSLWAYDTNSNGSPHLTNVNIGKEEVDPAVTVETYMDAIHRNLPDHFLLVNSEVTEINNLPGGRLFIEVEANGLSIKEVMYVAKANNMMWLVTFAAMASVYDQQLPVIEQAMGTFEISED